MKHLALLFLAMNLILITSCGWYPCEDKLFEISDELLSFMPDTNSTNITLTNGENETVNYTVSHHTELLDVTDEEGCTLSEINHNFMLNIGIDSTFLSIYADAHTYELFRETIRFSFRKNDGSILERGFLSYPLYNIDSIELNGTQFNEVISVENSSDNFFAIYCQKDVGLLAYRLDGELWMVE